MLTITKESTIEEIKEYLTAWTVLATKIYKTKQLAIGHFYNNGTENRFRVVVCEFSDITENNVSIDEKSNSSRHVSEDTEKTYKLRLTNLKNRRNGEKSFIQRTFNNETLIDISEDEFFESFETFKTIYSECANSIIFAQRAKQKKQKKGESTQMTLTVGHYVEYLLNPEEWKINCVTIRNGYDLKTKDGRIFEIKTCCGKIKHGETVYNFGGSTIELSKDF